MRNNQLVSKLTYLNIILTIIAVLLAINTCNGLGIFKITQAEATSVMPVVIENVRGTIPVSIKEPVSGYPNAVCVSPCR